ncbi:MAG TPA: hypothetical protein PK347_06010 [Burkholderiaceae bacterium]|nr:hypothetical protein [Burkholderiaceae bacterium]
MNAPAGTPNTTDRSADGRTAPVAGSQDNPPSSVAAAPQPKPLVSSERRWGQGASGRDMP